MSLACKLTQQPVQPISDLGRTMLSTCAGPATPHCGHVYQGSAGRSGDPLTMRRGGAAGTCSWSGSRAGAAHAAPVWQVWRHGDGVTACGRSWEGPSRTAGDSSAQRGAQATVCCRPSRWRAQRGSRRSILQQLVSQIAEWQQGGRKGCCQDASRQTSCRIAGVIVSRGVLARREHLCQ